MIRSGRLPASEILSARFVDYVMDDPCAYCGDRQGDVLDHIVPRAAGAPDAWDNLTAACVTCNASKGATPLLVWLARRRGAA